MAEEDKLHYFVSGLKHWAQLELRRQNVHTLSTAITAADALSDFNLSDEPTESSKASGKRDKGRDGTKGNAQYVEDESGAKVGRQAESSKGKEKNGKFSGCFTCGGLHLKRDFPVQQRVNAILTAKAKEKNEEGAVNNLMAGNEDDLGATYINSPLGLIK